MTLNLKGIDLIGLGNLLTSSSNTNKPTVSAAAADGSISIDELIAAPEAQNSTYVQNALYRAKYLGSPIPVEPTITLEEFINQLVVALAELFRARGYERIANYLITQHDLNAVFGQLAVRMLAIHKQTQRRESLIQKYLRVNSGASSLLLENGADLTFPDTPDTVQSMSSSQLGELDQILNGYSDGTGSHIGLNSIINQAKAQILDTPINTLNTEANAGELLDPTDGQIKAGINQAVSIAQKIKSQISTNPPPDTSTSTYAPFALVANTSLNTSGTNDTNNLNTASQSIRKSAYTQSTTTSALSDLNNNIVTPLAGSSTPLFPPLYTSGTSYSWNAFVTYGYQVYQCINQNGTSSSPISDPSSWLAVGAYPAGSAYQMKSLTSAINSDVSQMQTNGQVDFVQGTAYNAGNNALYSSSPYYATQNVRFDTLQAGSFPSLDPVAYQGSYYLNSSGNTVTVNTLKVGDSYTAGNLYYYNGSIYKATTSGTLIPPASSTFTTYSSYNKGDYISYNNGVYQVANSTGYAGYCNNGNGIYSTSSPTQNSTSTGGIVSGVTVPGGLFMDVTYVDGTTQRLTSSYSMAPDFGVSSNYRSPNSYNGYSYDGSQNHGLGSLTQAQIANAGSGSTSYLQVGVGNSGAPAYVYQNGCTFSFQFNIGTGSNPDGITFNYVNNNNPTRNAGCEGCGTTGVSLGVNTYKVSAGGAPLNVMTVSRYNNLGDFSYGSAKIVDTTVLGSNAADPEIQKGTNTVNVTIDKSGFLTSNYTNHNGSNYIAGRTLNNTGQNPAAWSPDGTWSFVFAQYQGSNTANKTINNFTFTPWGATINTINDIGVFNPDANSAIFSYVGTGTQSLAPDQSGSNFTAYNPATDTATWKSYSPSTDTYRWSAGVSPAVTAAQKELTTIVPNLASLFNTANFTPGIRQDLLDLNSGSANDTSTAVPVITTLGLLQAATLAEQQYTNLFTTWTNLLSQSSPNYSSVRTSATALQNQINSQITSASLSDQNQYWSQIQSQLSALISACNTYNKTNALAAIGPLSPDQDNDPNGTSLVALFQVQYSTLCTTDVGDYVRANIPLTGVVDFGQSPLLGMIQQIQTLQGYIARVKAGDTSIPAAQFYNLMKNTLENVYNYQPLTGTAIFSQADYTADQKHLAHAMITRGSGGITINPSLQTAENLGVGNPRGAALLELYRDLYLALGDTSDYNAVNDFIASNGGASTSGFQGYLATGSSNLSALAKGVGAKDGIGVNGTVESTHLNRKHHYKFPKQIWTSRKATQDTGWKQVKGLYDKYKGQTAAMIKGINVDLLFAADQYVGDNYVAGTMSQVGQRVYYNGQFYKAVNASTDDPGTGVNTGNWELMNWNPNRSRGYVYGDVVQSNGLIYRCVSDHTPSSDPTVTPGNIQARDTWACLTFQSGYTYLPGDTVLVSSGNADRPFTPYVAQYQYTSTNIFDLNNSSIWQVGYNNAVTLNGGNPQPAATLNGLTAIVNGANTTFDPTITSYDLILNATYAASVSQGTIFSTLLNAQNNATTTPFGGWCNITNGGIDPDTSTAGGVATTYDGIQFFNPALQTATKVMESLQMLDLFFYAHQKLTVSGGGCFFTGYNSPMIALTYGQDDEGYENCFETHGPNQSPTFSDNDRAKTLQYSDSYGSYQTPYNKFAKWAGAQVVSADTFYPAVRALVQQLKKQYGTFQSDYNTMILQVQQETYRLLAQAFINTIDLQASLLQLFRNAPLSEDEKKLLAKILAVILSLLISILGSDPRIAAAFSTQSVTSLSATGAKQTETQWTFDQAFSGIVIGQKFANDIIAKAITLANEMLSEKSRGSSVSEDRLTTKDYLNMNALIRGQQDALNNLNSQTTGGTTYV